MLTNISIKNFIIIKELSVDIKSGMTVITGETGAGKSILINAIEIGLGKKMEKQMIVENRSNCEISLSFDVSKHKDIEQWILDHDFEDCDQQILIRRVITPDNRTKNYVNGTLTNVSTLKSLTTKLINIHGQHENQSILNSDTQLQIIDSYAEHSSLLSEVKNIYQEWHKTTQAIATLKDVKNSNAKVELLNYQITEIENIENIVNNLENLEARHSNLSKSEETKANLHQSLHLLDNDESGMLNNINLILQKLMPYSNQKDPDLNNSIDCLEQANIQLKEATDGLNCFLNTITHNPEELLELDNQLQKAYDIANKHKINPKELANLLKSLTEERDNLTSGSEILEELQTKVVALENDYQELAIKLTYSRKNAAKNMDDKISSKLKDLDICGPFSTNCKTNLQSTPKANGLDQIEFLIKTNPDSEELPLNKIASGGELSRISLAIQAVAGEKFSIPCLVFDEVDVGISGATAEIVGKLLKSISKHVQIICITHLAQVASIANTHLQIKKQTTNGITTTTLIELDEVDQIQEIARILGGINLTKKTVQHAKEMVLN